MPKKPTTPPQSVEDFYTLTDGRIIEDSTMSSMMRKLVDMRPHQSLTYSWDDIGTASLMSDLYADSIRYCPNTDTWYIWEDRRWKRQGDDGGISDRLQTLLNLLVLYCKEITPMTEEKSPEREAIEGYAKYVRSLRKFTPMRNVMGILKTMVRMPLDTMDTNPYLLTMPDKTIDLKTGKRVEDTDEYNVTKMTTCTLPTPFTIRCDRWYQFIDEITSHDKEKAAFLQRALGYSLLGVNREECMFIAYGARTRNGKGTLFSTICTVLGSDYSDSAPTDLICESKSGRVTDFNAPQPALAKLVGTRLVTMAESSKDVRLDAASMKTLTGRDTLVTRGLFQNSFSFVPQFTLWLNTNHLPAVTDETVFSSNRIHVIEFNEHFGDAPDRDLKELFADPDNRPTILKWLVDGCREYMKRGLEPPECVIEATRKYRKMHDRIGNFLEDRTMEGEDKQIKRGDLYTLYTQWCLQGENKYRPLGSTTFYNEIAMRGYELRYRHADGWCFMRLAAADPAGDTGKPEPTPTVPDTHIEGVKIPLR
jgi:putative DNA primase/helicase